MNDASAEGTGLCVPFDCGLVDRLMEAAGLDALVVNSKHNTRYMLGGHRFFFFQTMDAIGHSRYLPLVVYLRGAPDRTAYVGSAMEAWDHALRPFWTPHFRAASWGTRDAAGLAAEHLKGAVKPGARIGVEYPFLPMDAHAVLAEALPEAAFADATPVLERLRAIKRPDELERLRIASDRIVESMLATIAWAG
ncbi:MAG: aminopeptidase P family N-terminal domain-containing protein, partial [Paracoccaceae bacterium]|nr:aminopeptidase P family N-terminal domain-containing protein [Paracoccaceae bacterium]